MQEGVRQDRRAAVRSAVSSATSTAAAAGMAQYASQLQLQPGQAALLGVCLCIRTFPPIVVDFLSFLMLMLHSQHEDDRPTGC